MATTAKQLTQALNGETTIELAYPVRLATGQLLEKVTVRRARVGDLRAAAQEEIVASPLYRFLNARGSYLA